LLWKLNSEVIFGFSFFQVRRKGRT